MPSSSFFDYKGSSSSGNWPSIEDSYKRDWGDSISRRSTSSGGRKTEWGDVFSSLFDKTRDTDKYRNYGESSRPYFGDWSRGGGGQVLENLGVIYPQQQGPMFLPGVEGRQSPWGKIGQIAGTIGGALIGGPAGASIGGSIGGTAGSFF